MTATKTATIAGVSDEQLAALIAGRWVDDGDSAPGWQRWVAVKTETGWRQVRQSVFPSADGTVWRTLTEGEDEAGWVEQTNSLEEALTLCDNWAEGKEIYQTTGTATRQTNRFANRKIK